MNRLQQLKAFHDEDPNDSFVRFAIASEYLKLDRKDEALEAFEGLVDNDPAYVGTYYHLGKLYECLGETEKAVETYKKGIEVAREASDQHSLSELQSALLEAEGIGFD